MSLIIAPSARFLLVRVMGLVSQHFCFGALAPFSLLTPDFFYPVAFSGNVPGALLFDLVQ